MNSFSMTLPTDDFVNSVSERYIELYEAITGDPFVKADVTDLHQRIDKNVKSYLLKV